MKVDMRDWSETPPSCYDPILKFLSSILFGNHYGILEQGPIARWNQMQAQFW
jgi:hypothetical protein